VLSERRGLSAAGGRYILTREIPPNVPGVGYLAASKDTVRRKDRRNQVIAELSLAPGVHYLVEGVVEAPEGDADLSLAMKVAGEKGTPAGKTWPIADLPGGRFLWLSPRHPESIRQIDCSFVCKKSDGSPLKLRELCIWGIDPRASTDDLDELLRQLHSPPAHPYRLAHQCKDGVGVYVNDEARPLACLVSEVRPASDPHDAVNRQIAATESIHDVAFVSCPGGESHGWRPEGDRRFSNGTAKVSLTRPDDVRVTTTTEGEGFLVLGVTKTRGWTAEVDGKATPIHSVDGPLMGVRVPAGEHEVRFTFRPVLVHAGLLVSATTLGAAWLIVAVGAYRARRRRTNLGSAQQPLVADDPGSALAA
jgi:hypothetical protein